MPRILHGLRGQFIRRPLRAWLVSAAIIRLLSAWTHSSWTHPDEWYQTVEFANLLVNGFTVYSQEVGLHLRNQTWPFLLAFPLALSKWMAPEWVGLRIFFVQAFTGLLDLIIVWGWWHLSARTMKALHLPAGFQHLGLALLILPFFTVHDSIRPNGEHLSAIAAWASLGFLANGRFALAGGMAVAIAAFRYPSGLLSAGIALTVLILHVVRNRDRTHEPVTAPRPTGKDVLHFCAGTAAGLAVFGIPDWIIYGRPWESLWMYLQYNVFSGTGAELFGEQPASVYWPFFKGRWFTSLLPIGVAVTVGAVAGLLHGLRRLEPWSIALIVYLAGHFLVSHKEARFMYPADALLIWAAFSGWALTVSTASRKTFDFSDRLIARLRNTAVVLLGVVVTINGARGFHAAIIGESFKPAETYFEVNRHLSAHPDSCAIITVRRLLSVHYPWSASEESPRIPLGFHPMNTARGGMESLKEGPVVWVNRRPECRPEQSVLIHLPKPDPLFDDKSCQLLRSGALKFLPRSAWSWALRKNWVSGPWYSCPSRLLGEMSRQVEEHPLSAEFGRIPTLPPLGTRPEHLLRLGQEVAPMPDCTIHLCAPTYSREELRRRNDRRNMRPPHPPE